MTTGSRTEGLKGIGSEGFIRTVKNLTVTGDLVVHGETRSTVGTGHDVSAFWETADANAEYWAFELPTGTSQQVPVLGVGVGLDGVDLGLFNGITQPTVVVLDADRDSFIAMDFQADDVARLRTNAATLRFGLGGTDEIIYTTGALAFQQTSTIGTSTGDLLLDPASDIDVIITSGRGQAFTIQTASDTYYTLDSRGTSNNVVVHAFDAKNGTPTSASTGRGHILMKLNAMDVEYIGTTQVTDLRPTMQILATTIAGDTATLTVDKATGVEVVAPTEGSNVTLTAASAIRILNAGGTPTNQMGLFIESLTSGATADYAIYMEGTPVIHGSLPAASAATNISLDGSNNFQQDTSSTIFKDDQADMEVDSNLLYQLAPRSWTWNELSGSNGLRDFGFVAQEVAAVHPLLANWKGSEVWSNNWQRITTLLVAEVQKLKAQVVALSGI